MRYVTKAVLYVAIVVLPTLAHAQSLAGTVRDASGAVLPGVTVEAASPVLIEKTRAAVTDGSGQYRIENLLPGTYTITYTLPGFVTVRREGVEMSGAGVIAVNAEMRVGGIQETITVTGETPVVDVQSSTRRTTVLDDSIVSTIPASRGYGNLLATVPGISGTGLDVSSGVSTNFFTSRGGRGNEGTIQIDGMNVGSAFNGGGVAGFGYPTSGSSEIQVTVSGGLGEADRGGPQFNMIPRTGGNNFSGTYFLSTAGSWSQGSNLDDELRSFGIAESPELIKNWDTDFALGGPIVRDRLWFFGDVRSYGQYADVPGLYANRNAGNPAAWFYEPDTSLKARTANAKMIGAIRLTGQLTPKNKVGFYYDYQKNCSGSNYVADTDQCRSRGDDWVALGAIGGFGSVSPESGNVWDDREKIVQASWTSTVSNKLLVEAGLSSFNSRWGGQVPGGINMDLIPVLEQNAAAGVPVGNFTYRGWNSAPSNDQQHNVWRASASYVTGAHNLKIGYQAAFQVQQQWQNDNNTALLYTFNNRVPASLTQRIAPVALGNRTRFDAFYVQDQFTMGRVTFQGGLRYEHAWSWHPEGENGVIAASRFQQTPFQFPHIDGVTGYHDITPRTGVAWDVFGNGKTSIKGNFSKYLQPANNEGPFIIKNPSGTFQATTARSWTDANADFIPQCDLNSSAGNGECGPWLSGTFGAANSATRVNEDILHGWGIRPYDWQYGVSLQQEVLPRVSVDVAYSRRSWNNFFVTDNLAVGTRDYTQVSMVAPQSAKLPNGGGYPVAFNIRNTAFNTIGATDNYYTSADDYGDWTAWWQGVDFSINARMQNGLVFQGGTSSGAGHRDNCEVTAQVPELLALNFPFVTQQVSSCKYDEPWLTTFRGLVSYTVPRIDVLLSASMRSTPNVQPDAGGVLVGTNGASLNANLNAGTPGTPPITGGALAVGVPFQGVNLVTQGELYGDRINALDLRFGKILRFGGTRTNVALDLYNLFNANTGTAFNQAFGTDGATFLRPTAILNPRFVRFNVTFDF
jgi:hypothetical protein